MFASQIKKFCPASKSNTVFEFPEASVNEMQTRGKKSENAWCEEDAVMEKKIKGPSKRYFFMFKYLFGQHI